MGDDLKGDPVNENSETRFTPAEIQHIRTLSSRKAAALYKVGFAVWRRLRTDDGWTPIPVT